MRTNLSEIIFLYEPLNKHSVRALAAAFEKHFPGRAYSVRPLNDPALKEPLKDTSPLFLLSFATGRASAHYRLAEKLRALNPEAVLACGGPHPSALPAEALRCFDTVCVGEGEIALKTIVESYDSGNARLGIIQGERVENLDEYPAFPRTRPQLGPIEIMRGCPGGCNYCQTPQLFPGRIRHRSPEMIAGEILFASNRKSPIDARFIAPDASFYMYDGGVNLPAIEKLLLLSKKAAGKDGRVFFGTFPSELDPHRVTPELVDIMKRLCDNQMIVIGLQSASDRMLKLMNRRADSDDASRAAELFLNAGYKVVVDFIFGLPGEDSKSVEDTVRWIKHWRDKVVIHSHPFSPLPGSLWAHMQPSPLPGELLTLLRSLEGRGGVFGRYE